MLLLFLCIGFDNIYILCIIFVGLFVFYIMYKYWILFLKECVCRDLFFEFVFNICYLDIYFLY